VDVLVARELERVDEEIAQLFGSGKFPHLKDGLRQFPPPEGQPMALA